MRWQREDLVFIIGIIGPFVYFFGSLLESAWGSQSLNLSVELGTYLRTSAFISMISDRINFQRFGQSMPI